VNCGRVVWFIGASGAGKDSLMRWLRDHGDLGRPVRIARRSITRPAEVGAEDHRALDPASFLAREAEGAYALSWRAHGCCYAIPRSELRSAEDGGVVLIAGSRAATDRWLRSRPASLVVLVRCSPEILAQRLAQRARADGTTVDDRMERAHTAEIAPQPDWIVIDNDGELAAAGRELVRALRGRLDPATVTGGASA